MSDCPICYEIVSLNKNCIITECGHIFHASCMMKHTSMNGYACPCCRTQMADEPNSANKETENYYEENNDDQYVLDGCRWLFQRANNEAVDDMDPYTDQFERWRIQMAIQTKAYELEMERKTNLVLKELTKIKAISYEDLVKGYLFWNQEHFYANSSKYEFNNRKVTSTIRSLLEKIS